MTDQSQAYVVAHILMMLLFIGLWLALNLNGPVEAYVVAHRLMGGVKS